MKDAELVKRVKREKWRRFVANKTNLDFLLHAGQRRIQEKFRSNTSQLFVANVSRQFGKSFWAVTQACEMAFNKPRARIKYGTAYQTDLTEFILPTFHAVFGDSPDHLKPRYKVQGSKWVFPNGSEIKLVGLDKSPNSLRGNVIDMIVIDEAGFVENLDYLYSSIIIPATAHRPNCRIIMISTPPSTPAHSFGDFIQLADSKKSYVKMTVYDNPLLTDEDINRLAAAVGGKHTTTFRREFMCELILDADLAIIPEYTHDIVKVPEKDKYYELYHKYVGMDLGRKDHTALLFGYWDFKRAKLCIEDELTMAGPSWTTVTLKDAILKIEGGLWGDGKPFRRVSDNNNPHLIMDLNSLHDVHFMETSKESLEAMVNEVRILIKNNQLEIHPKCTMLRGCLEFGVWDKQRKEFARNKIYGHFDHLAALIYLVRNLARSSNPIPADFGHSNVTSWMGHINHHTRNANTIAKAFGHKKLR